jgi:hypothetical protein
MLKLFDLSKVLKITAGIVVVLLVFIISPFEYDKIDIVRYTLAIFTLVLMPVVVVFWNFVWNKISFIPNWLFPNLSGDWNFEIRWQSICDESKSGKKSGTAKIRHTLFDLKISVDTDDSKSEVIDATPYKSSTKEKYLRYIYKNERQNTKSKTNINHNGVVPQLKISDDFNTMEGDYFTDRGTKGQVSFRKIVK